MNHSFEGGIKMFRREKREFKRIAGTPSDVFARYGIPTGTLANLRWSKRGPRYFKKPGGRGVFYLLSDVEAWLLSQPVRTIDSIPMEENQSDPQDE
jgi:hypothetical protein